MIFLRQSLGKFSQKTGVYLRVNEDFEGKFNNEFAQKYLYEGVFNKKE
jgi:hypothetical protein